MSETMMNKCFSCKHKQSIPGAYHVQCKNAGAHVTGDSGGIRGGWFSWPFNFDPVWLVSCDGYEKQEAI